MYGKYKVFHCIKQFLLIIYILNNIALYIYHSNVFKLVSILLYEFDHLSITNKTTTFDILKTAFPKKILFFFLPTTLP